MLTSPISRMRLNLLMNHASRWADVDSFLPYEGRVEVRPKRDADLDIRIPEWVAPGDTECAVNGVRRDLAWDDRYARVGSVGTSDRIMLTFPIGERTDVVYVEKHRYVLTRRGNDVVDIDPPGRYCPLYQRRHYRDAEPRPRTVTRSSAARTWTGSPLRPLLNSLPATPTHRLVRPVTSLVASRWSCPVWGRETVRPSALTRGCA